MNRPLMTSPSFRGFRFAALGGLATAAICLAGCGSSSSSSSGSSTGASNSGGTSGAAAASKAAAAVAPYFKQPASIGVTTPLSKKPPAGKTVDVVTNTLSVGLLLGNEAVAAGKLLGWHVNVVTMNSTPEDVLTKLQTSIAQKPTAVIVNGQPRSLIKSAFKAATANHVAIVDVQGDLAGGPTGPLIADNYEAAQFGTMATATGNWVIDLSKGKADALLVAYANFPLSKYITNTTTQTIDQNCPGCKTTKLLVQAADTGAALSQNIVTNIERNPSIDYVVLQDGAMALGLDAALRSAGLLGKVTVLGNDETPETAASTLNGAELGWMAFSQTAVAYQAIDDVARYVVGDPTQNPPLMNEIFTKANLPAKPTPSVWNDIPSTLPAQYAKLWHVNP